MAELINQYVDREKLQADINYAVNQFGVLEKKFDDINAKGINIEIKTGDSKDLAGMFKNISELKGKNEELTATLNEYKRVQDGIVTTQAKLNILDQDSVRTLVASKIALKEKNDQLRESITGEKQLAAEIKAEADAEKKRAEERKVADKQYQDGLKRAAQMDSDIAKQKIADETLYNKQYAEGLKRTMQIEADAAALREKQEIEGSKRAAAMQVDITKQRIAATDGYKQLAAQYNDIAGKAKTFYVVLGASHPVTLQTIADAKAMRDTLMGAEAAVGQFQRNVGNYNAVGSNFNQLLRELPNLAQSPQIFIQSLSNNISYFGEAVQAARAKGESWKQIIGTIGSSALGLVGIINIAVTAFTFLTNAFAKSGKEAQNAKSDIDIYRTALEKLHDEQERKIETKQNENDAGVSAAKRALDLAKAQNDKTKSDLTEIEKLEDQYYARKREKLERERDYYADQAKNKFTLPAYDPITGAIKKDPRLPEDPNSIEYNKRVEALKDLDNQREIDRATNLAKVKKTILNDTNTLEKRLRDGITEAERKAAEQSIETDKKTQEAIISNDNNSLDERIAARWQYHNDVIALIELEKIAEQQKNKDLHTANISEINGKKTTPENTAKLIALENERYQKENLNITTTYAEKTAQAVGKYADDSLKDLEDTNAKLEKEEAASQKRRFDGFVAFWAAIKKGTEEAAIAENKDMLARLGAYNQVLQAFINIGNSIGSALYDNKIQKQDEVIKNIDLEKQLEIDRINATAATDLEARQQIADVDAKALIETKKAEDEKKRLTIEKAKLNKAVAIAEIISRTALAVITALTQFPSSPANIVLAIAAGVTGAASLAAAIAAPLPGYYTGVDHSPAGFAKLAERGSEMRVNPDGSFEYVPRPTVSYLEKGTTIIPHDETRQILDALQMSSLSNSFTPNSTRRTDMLLAQVFTEVSNRSANKIVAAINEKTFGRSDHSTFYNGYFNNKFKS